MSSIQAEEVTWNRGLIRVQGWDLVWVSSYWAIVLCNTWFWVFFYYYCYDFWYWLLLVEAEEIIILFVSFIKMFSSQSTILLLILLSIPLWRGEGDQWCLVIPSGTKWPVGLKPQQWLQSPFQHLLTNSKTVSPP